MLVLCALQKNDENEHDENVFEQVVYVDKQSKKDEDTAFNEDEGRD